MSTYTATKPLKPNTPIPVLERDEQRVLIGAYTGYWDFNHQLVRLYPDMRHPFVHWRGTPRKKIINDSLVKVEVTSGASQPSKRSVCREGSGVKSQTASLRKLPIEGQEKMKF